MYNALKYTYPLILYTIVSVLTEVFLETTAYISDVQNTKHEKHFQKVGDGHSFYCKRKIYLVPYQNNTGTHVKANCWKLFSEDCANDKKWLS